MRKIRWVQISISSLIATQVACSVEDLKTPEIPQANESISKDVHGKIDAADVLANLNLQGLPKAVDGRARCACQQRTGH